MDRRGFLKTMVAGSMMVMLPSLAESSVAEVSASDFNTVEDLTAWMESRYECYMGEPKAYMSLSEEGLKKYNLSLDDMPIEQKFWDMDADKFGGVNLIYSTVAYAVEGNNPKMAERKLVRALKESFEKEAEPQKLIWRVKPEFTSDHVTEFGDTWATREDIEDKLLDKSGMPMNVEYDFDTDKYRYVKSRYVLNKLRMRLVFPQQIAEDYEELTVIGGGHPKRI